MDKHGTNDEAYWTNDRRIRQAVKEKHERKGRLRIFSRHMMFGAVARGVSLRDGARCWPVLDEIPEEEEEEPEEGEERERESKEPGRLPAPTDRPKKLVLKYHNKMGHPAKADFIRLLKCSHARPSSTPIESSLVKYARRIGHRLRADEWALPTHELIRMVALDTVFMKLAGGSAGV